MNAKKSTTLEVRSQHPFPSDEELKDIFKNIESNDEVSRISGWKEHNSDTDLDEQEISDRGLALGPLLFDKFKQAVDTIGKKK
jgi:hypothetical protein